MTGQQKLALFLHPQGRETIAGDLLEEYRKEKLPSVPARELLVPTADY